MAKNLGLLIHLKESIKLVNQKTHPISFYKDKRIADWSENSVYKLPNGDIVEVYHDVTEKKKAEDRLIQSEKLLNQVGKISKIGGWEMDMTNGGKAKWTKSTYDIVEIGYDEPIPGYDEHINYYLPKYRKMIREKMKNLLTKKEPLHFQAQVKDCKK